MNKKRIVGVALAVGACGVLAAAGMMLSKKSGAVVLDQAGNEIAKLILQDGKISYECEDKYQSYADIVSQEAALTCRLLTKLLKYSIKRSLNTRNSVVFIISSAFTLFNSRI